MIKTSINGGKHKHTEEIVITCEDSIWIGRNLLFKGLHNLIRMQFDDTPNTQIEQWQHKDKSGFTQARPLKFCVFIKNTAYVCTLSYDIYK